MLIKPNLMKVVFTAIFLCLGILATAQQSTNGNNSLPFKPAFWVVDGVKVDTATMSKRNIDSQTIESIHIWKGDSAVVRFGEQGRAGVVVMTTKAGGSKNKKHK